MFQLYGLCCYLDALWKSLLDWNHNKNVEKPINIWYNNHTKWSHCKPPISKGVGSLLHSKMDTFTVRKMNKITIIKRGIKLNSLIPLFCLFYGLLGGCRNSDPRGSFFKKNGLVSRIIIIYFSQGTLTLIFQLTATTS